MALREAENKKQQVIEQHKKEAEALQGQCICMTDVISDVELTFFIERIKSEDGEKGKWMAYTMNGCLYDDLEKYKEMLDKKQEEHQQQLQEYEEKLKSLQGK